jgi:hypothetical protein
VETEEPVAVDVVEAEAEPESVVAPDVVAPDTEKAEGPPPTA